jgi:hypothetical protein
MSCLTKFQKSTLARLATRAFRFECAKARGRNEEVNSSSAAAAQFRHDQVAQACGKLGLTCCSQYDYKSVEAHFLNILGQTGAAFNCHMAAQSEPRRQAEAVLVRELARFNINISYAASICRNQFKCSLDDASEKQIWCLVYTVRNRGNARRQKLKC